MFKNKILREDITYTIISCCYKVHASIGGGLLESSYQKALSISFKNESLEFIPQYKSNVYYEGEIVGKCILDFLVEKDVVVEIKKTSRFSRKDIEQVERYLQQNNFPVALLINFGADRVNVRRIQNPTLFPKQTN